MVAKNSCNTLYDGLVEATKTAFEQLTRKEGPLLGTIQYWEARLAYIDRTVSKHCPSQYDAYISLFGERFKKILM